MRGECREERRVKRVRDKARTRTHTVRTHSNRAHRERLYGRATPAQTQYTCTHTTHVQTHTRHIPCIESVVQAGQGRYVVAMCPVEVARVVGVLILHTTGAEGKKEKGRRRVGRERG
jgi:hypothetical protein